MKNSTHIYSTILKTVTKLTDSRFFNQDGTPNLQVIAQEYSHIPYIHIGNPPSNLISPEYYKGIWQNAFDISKVKKVEDEVIKQFNLEQSRLEECKKQNLDPSKDQIYLDIVNNHTIAEQLLKVMRSSTILKDQMPGQYARESVDYFKPIELDSI